MFASLLIRFNPVHGRSEIACGEEVRLQRRPLQALKLRLAQQVLNRPVRAAVEHEVSRTNVFHIGRHPDHVLDTGVQQGDVEGRLFHELVRQVVRCDVDSDYLLASEPCSVDGSPVLLLHLDMGQFGKFLGGRIVEGASQAKNAIAGVAELEQLREMTDDALASVAGRADDEDCRSHSEFLDAMREQALKVKGCCKV